MRDCGSMWSKNENSNTSIHRHTSLQIESQIIHQKRKHILKKKKKVKHAQEFLDITDKLRSS